MFGRFRYGTTRYGVLEARPVLGLEGSLLDFLSASLPVTVYPYHLPQTAALPAVSYWMVSRSHVHNLQGAAGIARARIQMDAWSHNLTEARTLSTKLKNALNGYHGSLGDVTVTSCDLVDRNDFYEPPSNASDLGTYHLASDFLIAYREDRPTLVHEWEDTEDDVTPEETIYAYLVAQIDAPLYAHARPQKSQLPAMVYTEMGETREPNLLGSSGWVSTRIKLQAFAMNYAEASELAEEVRMVLHGLRGKVGTVLIHGTLLQDGGGTYVHPSNASDVGTYVVDSDYVVMTRELKPVR